MALKQMSQMRFGSPLQRFIYPNQPHSRLLRGVIIWFSPHEALRSRYLGGQKACLPPVGQFINVKLRLRSGD